MNEMNWMELMAMETQVAAILKTNAYTEQFGLSLSADEAKLIAAERQKVLKEQRRAELGASVLPALIREFCDSPYISQENFADAVIQLQEVFFLYKNEMLDEITDEELLHLMKQLFDDICAGSVEYLSETCLERFAMAIRAGYRGHHETDGWGRYGQFDEETHWDRGLYLAALSQLTGD